MQRPRMFQILLTLVLVFATVCRAQLLVSPDHSNGVYRIGEIVHWQIEWKGEVSAPTANYRFLKDGLETGQGFMFLSDKSATLETRFNSPGTMLVEVKWNST